MNAEGRDVIIIVPTIDMRSHYGLGDTIHFTFGGNVLAHRIDADGTWTKLKSSDLDALGLFLSYGLEAGFSLGYWPIGDRITIFARWEQDWSGSPFTKHSESIYRNELVYNKKMRLGSVTAGVRIPIILIRD